MPVGAQGIQQGHGGPCVSLRALSPPGPGCLAEKWTGKKGDLASAGEKPRKKKSGKKKKKEGKEQSEGARSLPEEESGVQEAAPLPHSPTDEL